MGDELISNDWSVHIPVAKTCVCVCVCVWGGGGGGIKNQSLAKVCKQTVMIG